MARRTATATPPPKLKWIDDWEGRGIQKGIPVMKDKVKVIADLIPDLGRGSSFPMFGAVVGAVQSGKTAAMIGLISHLFEKGYDVVTVFTGTKEDLYTQTALRMKNDLFEFGEPKFDKKMKQIGSTSPLGIGSHKTPPLQNGNDFFSPPIGKEWLATWHTDAARLLGRAPTLFVTKKRVHGPLQKMQNTIESLNRECQQRFTRVLRWAVIDDECDEVSAGVTAAKTPPKINEICHIGECVYIGFSATPQANLFSFSSNPNHPRDFCCLLRSPHYSGLSSSAPSADVCYHASSVNDMYCGGWVFHNWCQARGFSSNFFQIDTQRYTNGTDLVADDVSKALAHYLVSGAARWLLGRKVRFPKGPVPPGTLFPEPHSMLINPHSSQEAHWRSAAAVINNLFDAGGDPRVSHNKVQSTDVRNRHWMLAKAHIKAWVTSNQQHIEDAYKDHKEAFTQVDRPSWDPNFSGMTFPSLSDVKAAIEEIMPHVKMKVLNGATDDLLHYEAEVLPTGDVQPPPDIYTIAIGGINMGRGLTLKGLCTTMFLTNTSADDTTIQRQRWFGYRGEHIEHCRVFIPDDVWQSPVPFQPGLAEINSNDEELKQMIADNENNNIPPDPNHPAWAMLINSKMSNKMTKNDEYQLLFRGLIPIRWATPDSLDSSIAADNIARIEELQEEMLAKGMPMNEWSHPVWGRDIGFFCGIPFDGVKNTQGTPHGNGFEALEIADFLDDMKWHGHNPDNIRHPLNYALDNPPSSVPGGSGLHRSPVGKLTDPLIDAAYDPYLIAAYLRLWHYGHEDYLAGVQGVISKRCQSPPPQFNVLIRRGGRTATHMFPNGTSLQLGKTRKSFDPLTGHIRTLQFGSVNPVQDYGSDYRPDDIRDVWNDSGHWVTERRKCRKTSKDEPGLLLIYLMDDGQGNTLPLLLVSIPDSGPMVRYV